MGRDKRRSRLIVHFHFYEHESNVEVVAMLQTIIDQLTEQGNAMALDFTAVHAEVAHINEVNESVKALVISIATQLEDSQGDPAAVAAIAASLKDGADSLAAFVVDHTPAAEPPPAEEPPAEEPPVEPPVEGTPPV